MKNKKVPMRQCVGCRELRNKKDLMRILKTPDNNVIFDDTGRMNGRGAYICPSVECLKKARRTKAIERSLDISIPDEVYDAIERQMSELDKG
ncbi:MAG: RNase P modulator RnpM [Lachnospiraceae bacterium]